ncbi:MAG: YicC/YloC family endoribonuclease, partial [Candidatus Neomarinimicrobiota bacterium]
NSRYLDQKLRGLDVSAELELKIRERVRDVLQRGSVSVTISRESENGIQSLPNFNRERFEAIEKILLVIQRDYGRHIDLSDIITTGDLFLDGDPAEIDENQILKALNSALSQVQAMRLREGLSLQKDLTERRRTLDGWLTAIEQAVSGIAADRKNLLMARLKELVGDLDLDDNRIYQEVAILADKYDISEEITRSRSHFEQFDELMQIEEPAGKRLNFLLQEIGREINTIGSKSNSSEVVKFVVNMKDQLEKMREQIQNIL